MVHFNNVVDLDSSLSNDEVTYIGLDYSLAFTFEQAQEALKARLVLERNGPTDYDAPIGADGRVITSGGQIKEYRGQALLPQVEELWIQLPFASRARLQAGLYAFEVGNGLSLNGAYENIGATLSYAWRDLSLRAYYCRPDLVSKSLLGPRIDQDQEQGIDYESHAAHFFASDVTISLEENIINPYVGLLVDYTAPGKRINLFSAPIKKDFLGTAGCAFTLKEDNLTWAIEAARNFGKGVSAAADMKDVIHEGFMIYSDIDYRIDGVVPSFAVLVCSGNEVSTEAALNEDDLLSSKNNKAFSAYSPFNLNLSDSISASHVDIRPVVATGAGYGLNYGLPRPGTFATSDFDNIIIVSLGSDVALGKKLCIGLFGYYLQSFKRGVGMFEGQPQELSRELGIEADVFVDYKVNEHILISLLGGYFVPGNYYRQHRDDSDGSLLSPFVRGDGHVDNAYQIEVAMEMTF